MRLVDIESYSDCRIVANKEDIGIAVSELPVFAFPVVRCRDCRHSRPDALLDYAVKCTVMEHIMQSNDFCSYGEVEDG